MYSIKWQMKSSSVSACIVSIQLRPCWSLMYMCHLMLFGFLLIYAELQFDSFSGHNICGAPWNSTRVDLMWTEYKLTVCVSHHIGCVGRALTMSRRTTWHLYIGDMIMKSYTWLTDSHLATVGLSSVSCRSQQTREFMTIDESMYILDAD